MSEGREQHQGERRRFPRLKRPVFYRLPSFFDRWTTVRDVGLGGCRIYCDEEMKKGRRLVLEVLLPDGTTVESQAAVVWTARLPEGSAAEWEVGLQFHTMPTGGSDRLRDYLESGDEPELDKGGTRP